MKFDFLMHTNDIPMVLTKIYFLRIVLNRAKISLCLKASPIGKLEYLEMLRTYVQ